MASIFSPFSLSLSISPLHILTLIKRFNNDSKQSITAGLISSFHACTHSFALPRKRLRTRKDKAYTLGCRCLCMHAPGEKKKCYSWMQCDSFVFVCISGWLWADFPLRCNLGLWCSEEKEERKQQTWREERERGRWYRWERKSTSSHTETINKLSSQSISYGLASVIALCQSRVSAAWE